MPGAEGPPPGRCGYAWPRDHEKGDEPDRQSCCYRRTPAGSDRCIWHAGGEVAAERSSGALRAARLDRDDPPEGVSDASRFAELLDGAVLSGLELHDEVSFERTAMRNADLSGARLFGADLSGADLSGADLSNALLINADLRGAGLPGTDLTDADLSGADLTDADLSGADLSNASLGGVELAGADLTDVTLVGASLSGTDLREVAPTAVAGGGPLPDDLRGANLDGANLGGMELSGVDLSDASLIEAELRDARLVEADLSGANLSAADLSGARLDRATLDGARLLEMVCTDGHLIETDLSGVDGRGADFGGSYLREADLPRADLAAADLADTTLLDADLSGATLDRADLAGASLADADLSGASVEGARLNRADLVGADLVGARLYGARFGDARIDRGTRFWPDTGVTWGRLGAALRGGRQPYCAYDPRYVGEAGEPEIERAAEVYGRLESLARDNSLPRLASECFLGRKDVQFMGYRRRGDRLMTVRSLVPNLIARYGESPWRVLGTGAATVLACGLVYWAFELVSRAGEGGEPATLFESLYFSALTFTTLGYGDFSPVEPAGRVLAVVETSMGVILLAILVFVFGRRATR